MGWFDSVTDFITDNTDWLKPVVNAGTSIYGQYQKNQGARDALDAQRESEQQNYESALAEQQAYNKYVDDVNMYDWQNAQARAAAAAQQDALRRRYARKAANKQRGYYEETKGMYKPYQESGLRILPEMEKTYLGGVGNLGLLSQYVMNNDSMKKLGGNKAAFDVDVPLPPHLRR